jgi:cell wall-associated NlpC family hydrolase
MAAMTEPYVWGSVGPDGYDCSGFLAAIGAPPPPTEAELMEWYEEVRDRLHRLQAGLMLNDLATHPDLAEMEDDRSGGG